MQTVLNPLTGIYQNQLAASRKFADAIFSGREKIDRVLMDAAHRIFSHQLKFAETLAMIRDPQSAAATLQSAFLFQNSEDNVNYQKEIMRIFAEMQNEIGRSLREYTEQLRSNASASAVTPIGALQEHTNDTVINPMTNMFSVWESAFKEVAELAKKNMAAAQSTMESAANRAIENATQISMATAGSMNEAMSVGASGDTSERGFDNEEREAVVDKKNFSGSGKRK